MPEPIPPLSGTVPIPNRYFELLPKLSDTEGRVYLIVLRQTLGWRERTESGFRYKERDWMTHGQLMQKTGRSSEALSRAIAGLIERRLIICEDERGVELDTAAKRRRHLGRVYFRPVDMWKTNDPSHVAKAKTTTYTYYNIRGHRNSGWQKAVTVQRSHV